jgi:CHAD domain-containing protein
VRYTLEILRRLWKQLEPIMEPLKTVQEKLGAIIDCAATLEMVRQESCGIRSCACDGQ